MKKILEYIKGACKWIGADGLQSICVCALIMAAFGWLRPLWIPAILIFILGLAKEVYDQATDKGIAEYHDIVCNAIGITVGLLIIWLNGLA